MNRKATPKFDFSCYKLLLYFSFIIGRITPWTLKTCLRWHDTRVKTEYRIAIEFIAWTLVRWLASETGISRRSEAALKMS